MLTTHWATSIGGPEHSVTVGHVATSVGVPHHLTRALWNVIFLSLGAHAPAHVVHTNIPPSCAHCSLIIVSHTITPANLLRERE